MKKYLNLIKNKKRDFFVIFLLFVISTLIFYIFSSNIGSSNIVFIKYKNQIYKYPLNRDRIINLKNGKIVIQIKAKKVRVKESDCPEKICILTGWISKSGQIIVCVPNKLIIKILGKTRQKIDSISR